MGNRGRALLLGDVVAVARALMACEVAARDRTLRDILREARAAERHRRRWGRCHPLFGDGSLMAAALRRPCVPEPGLSCATYRACLVRVLLALDGDAR